MNEIIDAITKSEPIKLLRFKYYYKNLDTETIKANIFEIFQIENGAPTWWPINQLKWDRWEIIAKCPGFYIDDKWYFVGDIYRISLETDDEKFNFAVFNLTSKRLPFELKFKYGDTHSSFTIFAKLFKMKYAGNIYQAPELLK